MRILCVEQFSDFGGGQRSLLDLLPSFSARGWEAQILVPGDGPFPIALRQNGYCTTFLHSSDYSSMRKPARELIRYACELPKLSKTINTLARQRRFHLLYVNGPRFLPAAAYVAACRRIPLVFHCHNRLSQPSAIALAGVSLRASQAEVIACCRHAAEPLKSHICRRNLSIIYNGVNSLSRRAAVISDHMRRIGVLGRIEPEKGQAEFVRAAEIVARNFPDSSFWIAGAPLFSGNCYYDEVANAAKGLPVHFLGWQTDVSRFLSSLDLLVVPSTHFEATTRVILEAYSAGVPVVAFPSGGIPEILIDRETGFLASSLTPDALAARIMSVLTMDVSAVRAVVERARAAWEQRYSLIDYQEQVCKVLARVASVEAGEASRAQRLEGLGGTGVNSREHG